MNNLEDNKEENTPTEQYHFNDNGQDEEIISMIARDYLYGNYPIKKKKKIDWENMVCGIAIKSIFIIAIIIFILFIVINIMKG